MYKRIACLIIAIAIFILINIILFDAYPEEKLWLLKGMSLLVIMLIIAIYHK